MHILPHNAEISVEEALDNENVRGRLIGFKGCSFMPRGQVFDTSLGMFKRRSGKGEHAACSANLLLIMERSDRVSLPNIEFALL